MQQHNQWWKPGDIRPETEPNALREAFLRVGEPVYIVGFNGKPAVARGGTAIIGPVMASNNGHYPLYGYAPPLHPANLGDPAFKNRHGLKYAYVAGAMANGITSVEMVEAAARGGMIGFFGAAGLPLSAIESAIDRLQSELDGLPFGMNLIHSPNDPAHENNTVDLYLKRGIRKVSASAYLALSPPLVRYRVTGLHKDADDRIVGPNKVVAKVSRVEVAEKFFSPPPEKTLRELVRTGQITPQEAELARFIPVAEDLTAEADSGGHTDNRPAIALLPTMTALRERVARTYPFAADIAIGLGGGIATPTAAAAAFGMGAAYLVTGSVNQACVEAGTSDHVKRMLAEARQADVVMAPAADMFEMGVKVQVLKRGTMFAVRAAKLYDLYSRFERYEMIPEDQRTAIERDYLRSSYDEAWEKTRAFFEVRDPRQNERAEKDARHKMALVFRSYLGQSSRWAITGDESRKVDYQIWCGPAMGAFNEWTRGTFLEKPENRKTLTVAMNLLLGASVMTRINWLRNQGVVLPEAAAGFGPMQPSEIDALIRRTPPKTDKDR